MTFTRRWLAVGVASGLMATSVLFGNAVVSAAPGIAGAIEPTACTLNGQCPKQDEFKAGTLDPTTGDVSTGDDASNNSGGDTTSGDSGATTG